MKAFTPFVCGECGHWVKLATGTGRTREYAHGFLAHVPDDFLVPTCPNCGETYFLSEVLEKLDPILRRQFLRAQTEHYQMLVKILMLRHGAAKKDIVRACGITPSYLSHVLAGKRQASTTLTRLLEAFVSDGSEFERHRKGGTWHYAGAFPFAVKEAPADEWVTGTWTAAVNDNTTDHVGAGAEDVA